MSKNGFHHGGKSVDLFIQIEIAIGIEIEFNARWILKKLFSLLPLSVYFSCRQEKYQKKRAPRLGLWRSSRKRFFGAVRNSPAHGGLKQPARFIPKKTLALG
ncbi:MAG: hypothetical protein ACOZBW_14260, partial [Thermodesulfobacteriota bacterium]